ncbi:MAG: ATP-grasp domain-containing protein [Acidimicrobiales bacterium]
MTALPRLAVFDDQTSISILPFFESARAYCTIVWVVGWSPNKPSLRMLSRFGEVADLTGMQEDEAVEYLTGLQLNGVLVFSDAPIRLAAGVADRLDLPFHSPRSARLLTDKLAQRTALHDAGLPVPAFAAIRHGEAATGVPFPAVLKPRAGAGSRDTFKVESAQRVAEALAQCDPNEEFILEEWLPDLNDERALSSDLVSVESVARNGVIEHIMVSGRFPFAPPFRETGTIMPSDFSRADKEAVRALAGLAIQAMEVRHGLLHTEVKMTPDGPRIIEINGRLGGRINELMERIGGPSMYTLAVRLALGDDVGPVPVLAESPVSFFRWILPPEFAAGVESIEGLDEVRALPGVTEVHLSRPPGSAVDAREGGPMGHVMKISGLVASHSELLALDQKIKSSLRLTWRPHEGADVPAGAEPA